MWFSKGNFKVFKYSIFFVLNTRRHKSRSIKIWLIYLGICFILFKICNQITAFFFYQFCHFEKDANVTDAVTYLSLTQWVQIHSGIAFVFLYAHPFHKGFYSIVFINDMHITCQNVMHAKCANWSKLWLVIKYQSYLKCFIQFHVGIWCIIQN